MRLLKADSAQNQDQNIVCPFCKEGSFDLCGLKFHLSHGHCDVYENTETTVGLSDLLYKDK